MNNKSISRVTCRAIIGIFGIWAAGSLIAGCSSGGTGTTSEGFDTGPLVPFSFSATGKPGAMEKKSSEQAADVVASPTEGHFGMTETDNTDTCTSTCTFKADHQIGTTPNVWVTGCSELAESDCSIPGHNIYISDDPNYCVGKDNCLTAVITPSTSASGVCSIFLSGNKLSSKILTGGYDHLDLIEQSDFNCTTTAVGDFRQAGVRIAAVVGTDSSGAPTFPSALDGSVKFEPSAGFATDATLSAMYDEGYVWNTNQKASAVYRVADKNNMAISATISFPVTLTGNESGGTVTAPPQYGLLAGLQLCDEIDTGPAFCDSVADALTPTLVKLGSYVANEKATKITMSSIGGDRIASMKMSSTNTASLKTYSDLSATWNEVSSFKDVAQEMVDDVVMDVNENTQNGSTVSVLTTDASTYHGIIRQSQDGFTWSEFATINEAMHQASMVSDFNNMYVAYVDDDGSAVVLYCNVDACSDNGLTAAVEGLAGYASLNSISNIAYDAFNDVASLAVSYKDANGADHMAMLSNDDGWRQIGPTLDVTANQMNLISRSSFSQDVFTAVTTITYVDEDDYINMVSYNSKDQEWNAIIGLRATYTAMDSSSRTSVAMNAFASTAYVAVRDSTGLKLIEVDLATGAVREVGTAELNGYATQSAYVYMPNSFSVDMIYSSDLLDRVIAKEATINGRILIPCDGETCPTNPPR